MKTYCKFCEDEIYFAKFHHLWLHVRGDVYCLPNRKAEPKEDNDAVTKDK